MVCKKCGQIIDDDAKFCPNCGKRNNKKNKMPKFVWIILIFLLFVIIIKNPKKGENNSSSNTSETTVKSDIKLSYKVVNEGGTTKYVVIDTSFVNTEDLKKLGDKLKNDFSSKNSVQVFVFDDESVAKEWSEYSLKDENDELKDKHFVALYWKGGNRHDLWVMPDGMNGECEKIIFEESKVETSTSIGSEARYNVDLQNVSVIMEDGAFRISNNSGKDLTNVDFVINKSSKEYRVSTSVIPNGKTVSVGMRTFANKKNELFNPYAIKVESLTIYSDQGRLWVYAN